MQVIYISASHQFITLFSQFFRSKENIIESCIELPKIFHSKQVHNNPLVLPNVYIFDNMLGVKKLSLSDSSKKFGIFSNCVIYMHLKANFFRSIFSVAIYNMFPILRIITPIKFTNKQCLNGK